MKPPTEQEGKPGVLPGSNEDWRSWLEASFPEVCTAPFGKRHERLWGWFEGLEPGKRPLARVEVWPRGGAKSSTGELGAVRIGVKLARRFALIVSATQDQADLHVQSIAHLFEDLGVGRAVNRYGTARGWRRDQLRTENGFSVAGFGLDAALRGIKLDQYRPDLIVFDDIDSLDDTPETVGKKIGRISKSIIPAGSTDCAILFLQNLIHQNSIVSQLVDGRADFLHHREVPPPEPAVRGLEVAVEVQPNGTQRYRVTGGEATWAGQSLEDCEEQINAWGLDAFMQEAQHDVSNNSGTFFKEWNPDVHIVPVPCRVGPETNEWGIPHHWPRVGGGDWGHNHPTVVYIGAVSPDGIVFLYAESWWRGLHVDGPDGLAARMKEMPDFRKVLSWGFGPDIFTMQAKTMGGPTIAEQFLEEGVSVVNALSGTSGRRRHSWANMKRYLGWRDRLGNVIPGKPLLRIVRGTCPRLIERIPKMVYSKTDPEDMAKVDINPRTGEGGDDTVDGCNHTLMTRPLAAEEKQRPKPTGWTLMGLEEEEREKGLR